MTMPKRAFVVNLSDGHVDCPRLDKSIDHNLCLTKCRYCEGWNKSAFFDSMNPKTRRPVTKLKIVHCSWEHYGGER